MLAVTLMVLVQPTQAKSHIWLLHVTLMVALNKHRWQQKIRKKYFVHV
jgi:hypothetical protein